MKIVKSTGLVPVKALGAFDNYTADSVFGVTPENAKSLSQKRLVEILDTAGDEEMVEYGEPDANIVGPAEQHDPSAIEIPGDWAEQHHTKIIALARMIIGPTAPKSVSKEDAIKVVESEIARRAAVAQAQEKKDEP